MVTPNLNYQLRTMFEQILERYRQCLADLRADPPSKPSEIAYVEQCIKNFEDMPIIKTKPE